MFRILDLESLHQKNVQKQEAYMRCTRHSSGKWDHLKDTTSRNCSLQSPYPFRVEGYGFRVVGTGSRVEGGGLRF